MNNSSKRNLTFGNIMKNSLKGSLKDGFKYK